MVLFYSFNPSSMPSKPNEFDHCKPEDAHVCSGLSLRRLLHPDCGEYESGQRSMGTQLARYSTYQLRRIRPVGYSAAASIERSLSVLEQIGMSE